MSYEETYDVSSQEFWPNGNIRPGAIWKYMQESASRQMSAEGPSYEQLWQNGLAFILSRMNVIITGKIKPCENLTCRTWACDEKGASFCRSYELINSQGEIVVQAYAIWALLDTNTNKLCMVKDANLHYSSAQGLELPLPKKFRLPKNIEFKYRDTKKVYYSDTDCNHHMNNTNYPDMLCNAIENIHNEAIESISIYYVNEAPVGSDIEIYTATEFAENNIYYFKTIVNDKTNIEAIITTHHTN